MRGPVGAHKAAPVERKHNMEVLQGDVVNELVECPLEKRRINRHDRDSSLCCQSGREGHSVLFGDSDVIEASGHLLLKLIQSGPVGHRRGERNDLRVRPRQLEHRGAEHLRIGGCGLGLFRRDPGHFVKRGHAVESLHVDFRGPVPLPFLSDRVDEYRTVVPFYLLEYPYELGDIVAVDRTEVAEPERFEKHPRGHDDLDAFFHPGGDAAKPVAPHVELAGQLVDILFKPVIRRMGDQLSEVVRDRPDVRGDRHVIVVEDDDEVFLHDAGVVHPLVDHPSGHGTVADDRDHFVILAAQLPGGDHSQGRRDGRACMSSAERIILTLGPFQEPAQSPVLSDRAQPFLPPGEYFVRIRLVADVPDELVVRGVEDVVQRYSQLDGAEPCAQVSPGLRDGLDQELANVRAEDFELRRREFPDVRRDGHPVKTRIPLIRHSFSSKSEKLPSASLLSRFSASSAVFSFPAHMRESPIPSS